LRGHSPNFPHIHVSVGDLFILTIDLAVLLQEIPYVGGPILNVEIRTEVAQFPGKEYINGIFVTVHVAN
jgi:hypothetical protein